MTTNTSQSDIFFANSELDADSTRALALEALSPFEDGELFLEYSQSEGLGWDDGCLKTASFDTSMGFGLRAVDGERFAFAHATGLDRTSLKQAANTVAALRSGHAGAAGNIVKDIKLSKPSTKTPLLYGHDNPLDGMPFADKVALLAEMDAYSRAKDSRVKQVSCSLSSDWQVIRIFRADGLEATDVRPLCVVNVSVVLESGGRMETGRYGYGGREGIRAYTSVNQWQAAVLEALRMADVNMRAIPAPAGEMTVVLGNGWPGILLHEAIGHGLEGDFNRKETSAFSGLMGERIAAKGVTVVDDGTIGGRRGSLNIDDEGTPSGRKVLIEDGILTGFIQDRMNARLMNETPTGNGRRESFAHYPMPRMTNTYMLGGEHDPSEIIQSVDKGIYAVNFGGGQVDITSGKFVFAASEAYLIENGKIGAPIKGATLIGNGADALTKISMVGNDMALDPGIGTCGKDGQGVPVGVGQPTLKMTGLTVGGTA